MEKMKTLKNNMNNIRKLLMSKPRGHYDMFGVVLIPPNSLSADIGAMHNEGYRSMCGDAVMALGRYLVDKRLVKEISIPDTQINMQCPCGLVEAYVKSDGKKTGSVRFSSVSLFVNSIGKYKVLFIAMN